MRDFKIIIWKKIKKMLISSVKGSLEFTIYELSAYITYWVLVLGQSVPTLPNYGCKLMEYLEFVNQLLPNIVYTGMTLVGAVYFFVNMIHEIINMLKEF